MKAYIYFISYAHGSSNNFGFGSLEISLKRLISFSDDIAEIAIALQEKEKAIKNPVVLFFQLLRIEE